MHMLPSAHAVRTPQMDQPGSEGSLAKVRARWPHDSVSAVRYTFGSRRHGWLFTVAMGCHSELPVWLSGPVAKYAVALSAKAECDILEWHRRGLLRSPFCFLGVTCAT